MLWSSGSCFRYYTHAEPVLCLVVFSQQGRELAMCVSCKFQFFKICLRTTIDGLQLLDSQQTSMHWCGWNMRESGLKCRSQQRPGLDMAGSAKMAGFYFIWCNHTYKCVETYQPASTATQASNGCHGDVSRKPVQWDQTCAGAKPGAPGTVLVSQSTSDSDSLYPGSIAVHQTFNCQ